MLPENQAQSIAERLGIQTGKPLNEEIKMDTFDEPKFDNSIPKEDFMSQDVKQDIDSNIFGMSFFKDSPSTFAPIDLAPAPKDYVIGPGDEIRVQLFGNLDINRLIPVNREGNIIIPEIGVLNVSGLNFSDLVKKIKSLVNASLVGVEAEISLAKIRSIQIFVLGNSYSPGAYTVSSLSNISNILFFSGGPDKKWFIKKYRAKERWTNYIHL